MMVPTKRNTKTSRESEKRKDNNIKKFLKTAEKL